MEWQDEGIVLAVRKHGESSGIISLLTAGHGRHAGLVRGAGGRRLRGVLQPGNQVRAVWQARLPEHLGGFRIEAGPSHAAALMADPLRLAAAVSGLALVERAVPEREPHPALYSATAVLIAALAGAAPDWPQAYVRWELGLLAEIGFGLDLTRCAATGQDRDLAFVSPRSGRAVSAAAGAPYGDRLLPLPGFLVGAAGVAPAAERGGDVLAGLTLTGFFLERHVAAPGGRGLPPARTRFVERFRRFATTSGVIKAP